MFYHLISRKSKGQVFLLSILILSAVMTASLLLILVFTKDLRHSVETSESVKAFYAADAAMEWQIYNSVNSKNKIDESKWQMKDITESDNNYPKYIRTVGYSKDRKVSRGLEVFFGIK